MIVFVFMILAMALMIGAFFIPSAPLGPMLFLVGALVGVVLAMILKRENDRDYR